MDQQKYKSKVMDLATQCGMVLEASAKTAALARELFPPMDRTDDEPKLQPIYQLINALTEMATDGVEHPEYLAARDLAYEIFPPMAKPLEFSGSNIDQSAHTGYEQGYLLYFNQTYNVWIAQWRVHGNSYQFLQPYKFAELAEAISACEAHHQARFREMCA